MSEIKDGGPAFPHMTRWIAPDMAEQLTDGGMSLRDWFAGQALAGLSYSIGDELMEQLADGTRGGKFIAKASYTLADAMLAAREAKQ